MFGNLNLRSRRLLLAVALIGATAAAVTVPFAASSESGTESGLRAYVVPTNRGPIPACSDVSVCTPASITRLFIYVANTNRLTNETGGSRETFPNAYVVSSIDMAVFVDGVHTFDDFTWTPPPNAVLRGQSGNWPSTVTCPPSPSDPCNVVGSPAVDPLENTSILHFGWLHVVGEPNGTHVFRFTIHGTLNGTPIDLTASSPPILMTD
ncbi:MAG TPA: hypothetical protein VGJ40_04045 [Gaiellaceae bacterium]|jgi:hypothetical protein